MAQSRTRPTSPHLFTWGLKLHYVWGIHMTVSIINRMTGVALSTAGLAVLIWWLAAIAGGKEAYATFTGLASSWYGQVVLIGLSFCYFFHLLGGLRHFVMDIGAGFELKTNRTWAWAVLIGSVLLTGLLWLFIYWKAL